MKRTSRILTSRAGRQCLAWLLAALAIFPSASSAEDSPSQPPEARLVNCLSQWVGDFRGLSGSRAGALSPDGRHLYTVGPATLGIGIFEVDGAAKLRRRGVFPREGEWGDLRGALAMEISPDGDHLYVLSHLGKLAAFRRDPEDGALELIELLVGGPGELPELNKAADLVLSGEGTQVYVLSQKDGVIAMERDRESGRLHWMATVDAVPSGEEEPFALSGGLDLALGAAGEELLVAGGREGWVARLKRNPVTGHLSPKQLLRSSVEDVPFLGTVTSVAASGDGELLFVAGESPDAVTVFEKDGAGLFRYSSAFTGEQNPALVLPYSLALDAGSFPLYISGSSTSSSVLLLDWNGQLESRQILEADSASGAMAPVRWLFGAQGRLAFGILDGVTVARRDLGTGELEVLERYTDGGGVRGLERVSAVAVSPDGRHVLTAGDWGHIGVFEARGMEGGLEFLHHLKVDGLVEAAHLGFSGDGSEVQILQRDGTSHRLRRDPRTGLVGEFEATSFEGALAAENTTPGAPPVGGTSLKAKASFDVKLVGRQLEIHRGAGPGSSRDPGSSTSVYLPPGFVPGPLTRAWSPDGHALVVAVSSEGGPKSTSPSAFLAFFDRDPRDGSLRRLPWADQDRYTILGIRGELTAAMDPSGRRAYVAARGAHRLCAFEISRR